MTPEQKYAAATESSCCVTTENGEQQDACNLTTMPCVRRSLCLGEVINDSSNLQVEFPKRVDNQTRTCWNAVWPPVEKQQEQRPRGDLVHDKNHHLEKYEYTTNDLLKRNISTTNPVLTKMVFISLTWSTSNRTTVWRDDESSPSRLTSTATSSKQSPDKYWEGSKTNREITNMPVPLFHQFKDFGWFAIDLKTIFFNAILWCESWCRMSIATRSKSSATYCC